ncbi:MAG: transposase [Nitrospirae bacterium]|nr:transposase [Nitrospirota bacterium]
MPRIARVCAEGYPHHITQRGNNKEKTFFDDEDKRFYLDALQRYKDKYKMKILAYCLMGNHVHILAMPEKETSLARGIGGTNLLYTQYINRKYNRSGRLWQNRFFSSVVEKEPYLWAVMRYIEHNPVRAKLVRRAEDYAWSSARAHLSGIKDDVLAKESCFSEKEIKSYKEFLTEDAKEINATIRRATSTGRPFGSEGFIKKLERILKRNLFPRKGGRPKIKGKE